ncbi:hypothetical protein NST81_08880 [Bacillus sp. FSL W8-0223]|uniref:hypothetical protein n=1 Tax=Bacillus sp. FSL W8-0223 TaxID=2954595 RepID=UPI0030FB82BA
MILSEGKLPNSFVYNTSKTANNAMMVGFARELEDTDAQIFAVTPGPTSTDLNGHHPLGKSPAEGAKIIVDYSTDGKRHHGKMLMKDAVPFDFLQNFVPNFEHKSLTNVDIKTVVFMNIGD